jgi:hypothetical protein
MDAESSHGLCPYGSSKSRGGDKQAHRNLYLKNENNNKILVRVATWWSSFGLFDFIFHNHTEVKYAGHCFEVLARIYFSIMG